MINAFKERVLWIIPIAISLAFLALLFFQGAKTVSKQPDENWSRGIQIGESNTKHLPNLHTTDKGNYEIAIFNNGSLTTKTFSKDFQLKHESTMDVPFTKWDPFYAHQNKLIYFHNEEIIEHDIGNILAEAEEMYVQNGEIFYIQDNSFFSLDPNSFESQELGTIPKDFDKYNVIHNDDKPTIVAEKSTGNKLDFLIFQFQNGNLNKIQEQSIQITGNESIVEVNYASLNNQLGLIVKSLVENPGKDPYRLYLSEFQSSSDSISLREIHPIDPKTGARIPEIGKISASYLNDQLSMTFYGVGYSKVDYKTNQAVNIYQLNVIDDQKNITAQRRSNTYKFSSNSKLVNDKMVMWMDMSNEVYISSSQPELIDQADHYTRMDVMLALGITMNMLTKTIPFLFLSMKWAVWPLIFFVVLFIFYRKSTDNNYTWVLNSAIGVYLLGVLIQKDLLFNQTLNASAPAYLTFPGSSFVLIIVAGLIAYGCMQFIDRTTGAGYKVAYFVFVHLLLLSLSVGPYMW